MLWPCDGIPGAKTRLDARDWVLRTGHAEFRILEKKKGGTELCS
jgi:hypothetical protein